jgi:hypothetical protein
MHSFTSHIYFFWKGLRKLGFQRNDDTYCQDRLQNIYAIYRSLCDIKRDLVRTMGSLRLSFWAWVSLEDLPNQSSLHIRALMVSQFLSFYYKAKQKISKVRCLTCDTDSVTHRTIEGCLNGLYIITNVASICQLPLQSPRGLILKFQGV